VKKTGFLRDNLYTDLEMKRNPVSESEQFLIDTNFDREKNRFLRVYESKKPVSNDA